MKRLLFVANGHGENAIAARIAHEVERLAAGSFALDLFPVVGAGAGTAPLALVGPRAVMPSGGLVAMGNVRAFARDLRGGFVSLFARQLAFLRAVRGRYDAVVAVGDTYVLALSLLAGAPAAFVGTAKSVYVAPYGPFERTLLRRAALIFVRDEPTARALRARGVPAQAPGNVIVDLAGPGGGETVAAGAFALFPGSRAEAYEDGLRLARVLRGLGRLRPGVRAVVSIAPTLDAARFARALQGDGWAVLPGEGPRAFEATADGVRLTGWTGPLGALLGTCAMALGQAGTANEQAAASGVPVVALGGPGERDDWYRMRQRRLLGDALAVLPGDPELAAPALDALLRDEATLARMRAAGPERLGGPGGAAAIARAVAALAGGP